MKKILTTLSLVLIVMLIPMINVKAEGTVDEIRIESAMTTVTEGALPQYTVTTTTEHITIEAYGSNTNWAQWPEGYSSWHGFGTEEPTAVADDTTHYALRLSISLESGYTFGETPTIYFNGTNVTNEGHTSITDFGTNGFVYIDLGTATAEANQGNNADPSNDEQLQKISSVNVTIKAPKVGTEVKMVDHQDEYGAYQWPDVEPTITVESGANYSNEGSYYITAYPSMDPDNYDYPFTGTFKKDTYYYVEVYLAPKPGYEFADNVTLKVNGSTNNYELSDWNHAGQLMFYAKIKSTENDNDSKVLDGANQTYSTNSTDKLTFRFDIPFNEFKESGKVYMDGKLVDPKNYTISDGSTIVTFNPSYTSNLTNGNHTIRVTSNNNDISTDFKVISNPKTGDNILTYVFLIITSITGLIITTKKTKNILN